MTYVAPAAGSRSSSVRDRFELLADGRSYHSWLTQECGWSRGMTSALSTQGHVPGPKTLSQLVETDGVKLNWLLTGRGAPFAVQMALDEAHAIELASALLAEGHWTVCSYRCERLTVLLFAAPRLVAGSDARPSPGWRTRLVSGRFDLGTALLTALGRAYSPGAADLAPAEIRLLASGWLAPRKVAAIEFGQAPASGPVGNDRIEVDATAPAVTPQQTRAQLLSALEGLAQSDLEVLALVSARLAKRA